ncbi:MAG: hypothetical protein HKN74_07795 [Acidimicrobiia bacterium]|nr:hypothetical protein [Acidimicrobiia bacterium]
MTIAGTSLFAVALGAAVYLVVSVVTRSLPATIAVTVVTLIVAWSWFYVPLVSFSRDDS